MSLGDTCAVLGAIELAAIVVFGFWRSNRIPPSGRDPTNFEGPPGSHA
jgi:hypothetical protein